MTGGAKTQNKASEDKYLNCLREAFNAARGAYGQNAQSNRFTVIPDAASVVSAGIGFIAGAILKRSALGAMGGAAVLGLTKDVVAANIVRGAQRGYHSANIGQDLNRKVNDCNLKFGNGRASVDAARNAMVVYGNSLFQ